MFSCAASPRRRQRADSGRTSGPCRWARTMRTKGILDSRNLTVPGFTALRALAARASGQRGVARRRPPPDALAKNNPRAQALLKVVPDAFPRQLLQPTANGRLELGVVLRRRSLGKLRPRGVKTALRSASSGQVPSVGGAAAALRPTSRSSP